MATLQVNAVVIRCDGCALELNDGEFFPTATEARGAAYAAGWRFPPMRTSKGKPSSHGSDVCPVCLPGWAPALVSRRPSRRHLDGSTT